MNIRHEATEMMRQLDEQRAVLWELLAASSRIARASSIAGKKVANMVFPVTATAQLDQKLAVLRDAVSEFDEEAAGVRKHMDDLAVIQREIRNCLRLLDDGDDAAAEAKWLIVAKMTGGI